MRLNCTEPQLISFKYSYQYLDPGRANLAMDHHLECH